MNKLNLFTRLLILSSLIFTFSCTKQDNNVEETISIESDLILTKPEAILSNNIEVQNGLLTFYSAEDFRNSLLALNRMDNTLRQEWEQQLNFQSAQSIFNAIINTEYQHTLVGHSDLFNQKIQSGFIAFEGEDLYRLDIFNPAYAPVLNEQGMVVVGNTLYQFSSNTLKIWKNADLNQIEVLQNTTESNDEIRIVKIETVEDQIRRSSTRNFFDFCQNLENGERLVLGTRFNSNIPDPNAQNILFVNYSVEFRLFVQNDNGEVVLDPNAEFKITGNTEVSFTISNGVEEGNKVISENNVLVTGTGGSFALLPEAAGENVLELPFEFTDRASLESAEWLIGVVSGRGISHECNISF